MPFCETLCLLGRLVLLQSCCGGLQAQHWWRSSVRRRPVGTGQSMLQRQWLFSLSARWKHLQVHILQPVGTIFFMSNNNLLSHRSSERRTCYLDGAKVSSYPNERKDSLDLCMALAESNPDPEAEAEFVRELLKGEEWTVDFKCERIGKGRMDCDYTGRCIVQKLPTKTCL